MGRIILDTRKSSKSMMFVPYPKGVIPFKILNPNAHGKDSTKISMPFIKQAFLRLTLNKSVVQEIIFSKTANTVDNAAKLIKTKNKVPHNLPRGMLLKTFGKVINKSFGPLPTSTP